MPGSLSNAQESVVILVDMQESFLKACANPQGALKRCEFLLRMARLLGVAILATEQNPDRMGSTHPELSPYLPDAPFAKMAFSCAGCEPLLEKMDSSSAKQAVLAGIETHICVTQTAVDLQQRGMEVFVCVDAVTARSEERHAIGLERLRCAGIALAHSESIAYEWLRAASNPQFREALSIVKAFS